MAGRLEGKIAIVTGVGSIGPGWGNGKAAAVQFAREGATVFGVDINPAAAAETKAIIDGEGGAFGLRRQLVKAVRGRFAWVVEVQIGKIPRQAIRIGQAAISVVRHGGGHGQAAFEQFFQAGKRYIGRRYDSLLFAHEDAQAQVLALRTLQILAGAEAVAHLQRGGFEHDRIGGIRAAPFGLCHEV